MSDNKPFDDLEGACASLVDNYRLLSERFDPAVATALQSSAKNLQVACMDVLAIAQELSHGDITKKDKEKYRKKLTNVADKMPEIDLLASLSATSTGARRRGDRTAEDEMSLSQFFGDVSDAFVSAQKELNDQSLDYVTSLPERHAPVILRDSKRQSGIEGRPPQRSG